MNNAGAFTVEALANAPEMYPNAVVTPPGIDDTQFSPSASDDAVAGRVIAVGRLLARKGIDLLIRAVAQLVPRYRQVHLLRLARLRTGGGALRRLTNELGIDSSVTFLGNVPRAHVPRLLQSAQVYCHPARWDNVPFAPLEAMACGLPALVSSAGGLPDLVGEAGIVHAAGDENASAYHLFELLSTPRLRRSLGGQLAPASSSTSRGKSCATPI